MPTPYTRKRLTEVKDSAAEFGLAPNQEARFAKEALGAVHTGVSLHHLMPARRQPFGHRHAEAEEIYVVLSGSGRLKLDDDVLEIEVMDAIRVAPGVTRAFEAGPEGIEVLVFGPRHDGDGELIQGWWAE
jgi:mannose-6-phosphate isomerase-like protein (cupin superfamily)